MRSVFILFLLLCLQQSGFSQQTGEFAIIPAPSVVHNEKGSFIFSNATVIQLVRQNKEVKFLTDYLLNNWRFKNKIVTDRPSNVLSTLIITDKGAEKLPEEGYKLSVSPTTIVLTGKGAGLFYGIQTLIQLFPNEKKGIAEIPCVTIQDNPRFNYRGMMLDVSRHFFTVEQVKNLLDLMAAYKLNRFHWHLTDDQGWRVEIKSYPKLTSVGAWRVPRLGDFGDMEPPKPGEAATDGGFYTQVEIRDVVQYAAERHIEILPEIDVPGHCMAAIAAYPELCVTKNPQIKVNPGSSFAKWFPKGGGFEMYIDNALNPTDEKVYQFLDKVFGEIAELFPYKYIHVGGDECFKGFWEKDAGVQAFIKEKNIKSMSELQSYFISRVNKIVLSKGKKLIGWDEILDGGLNTNVAVMNRFGEKGAIEQVKKKLDIVMAPGNRGLYFDYAQSNSDMEPSSHGGYSPVWKTYSYDPEYKGITAGDMQYILGVEACVWTEHIPSVSKLQYMILPRMLAFAEVGWAAAANKDYKRFAAITLPKHLERFDKAGYNYRVPTAFNTTDTTLTGNHFEFNLKPAVPGARIFYTLNNHLPGDADHEYESPLIFTIPANSKRILKAIVITPAGRRSVVSRVVMDNTQNPKATIPVQPDNATPIDAVKQ